MDTQARGDDGRAHGLLQVRVDVWPHLEARYALSSVVGALKAGWEVYLVQGAAAWSCWDE